MVLNHVRNVAGSYVLVGGISNQCDCAMLAVLREDRASGSSPPQEPAFACENCPAGRPYRYILFPRSELTQLSGATYNKLRLIRVDGGRVWVGVSETKTDEMLGADWLKYELSDSFVPKSFTVSDHFWTLHRQMEAEGKIHHTVAQCPEHTQSRKVQMWSAEHGWEQIAVPVSTERQVRCAVAVAWSSLCSFYATTLALPARLPTNCPAASLTLLAGHFAQGRLQAALSIYGRQGSMRVVHK
jgi:hypothetical protein